VVGEFFDPKTRTVAIYRTKEGTPTTGDPELEAALADVPAEHHAQVKGMLDQLRQSTDVAQLRARSQGMEQMLEAGQVPEDQKPLMEYMVRVMEARVAELEAAGQETPEGTTEAAGQEAE
jgi:hypothetical protein